MFCFGFCIFCHVNTPPPRGTGTGPTLAPTDLPSQIPTIEPSRSPSINPSQDPTLLPTLTPTPSCGVGDKCPIECDNNPCDCTKDDVCNSATCDENGCDQCMNDYFKKDNNYPCTSCIEIFGDMCLHCTDFSGCQQCESPSVRVYDEICGLYYCEEDPLCIPTPSPSGIIENETPSPTRSPIEEEEEEPETSTDDCIDGYFTVDSISDINNQVITDYDYLLGKYSDSGDRSEEDIVN